MNQILIRVLGPWTLIKLDRKGLYRSRPCGGGGLPGVLGRDRNRDTESGTRLRHTQVNN